MHKVEIEPGVRLRLRHRTGDGQPFLLVHGLASNARLWDEVAEYLAAAGHPSWSVDLRGHGESDSPDDGYDTQTAASDVAEVITRLGLVRPVVAGQSWGGNIVVRLAAKYPELVGGLALVDGGWIDLQAAFPDWMACERALRPPDLDGQPVSTLRRQLRLAHPGWSESAIAATEANLRVRDDGTVERRLPIERHLRILRSLWDEPPWPFLAMVGCPTLLLPAMGPDDKRADRVTAAAAAIKAAGNPAATIRWYGASDHDLHAQQPERVATDLLSLVDRA